MNTDRKLDETTFIAKYKPYKIDDFFLEPAHNRVLKMLIDIDELNILLVGNSCSGKTSLVDAFIRDYYNLPITASFPDDNILIINNLKEQGIHYFRSEMKTFCQSRSNIRGKKKMIIVDDIDLINEQSQQVFRNYIDKHSHNVLFISVCTNIQKVNESLQSRLHIIKITPCKRENLVSTMEKIIEKEGLNIDADAREFILDISDNSVRVLINYLEKIYILGEHVTLDIAHRICANISYVHFERFIDSLNKNDLKTAVLILYEVHEYGYSVIDILDYFFSFVKMTNKIDEELKYEILPFLCKYITIFHKVHEDVIELAFFANNLLFLYNQYKEQNKDQIVYASSDDEQ
jgi:DNA polymerase III delta prime subunit